jgi:ABC-type multidrug transport system ATPase subunit
MALQIRSVCQRFKNQEVLHDVSLTVEAGDCYGLLGHNGAGKTTVMRVALGLLTPTRGSVAVDGFECRACPREARARLSGLIEYPCFHEGWNGHKNLCVLARLQGLDGRSGAAEADRVLQWVGLDTRDRDLARKKVRDYSQGMRQRLGIAQALLGHPSYVLLDEPMSGLDPRALVELRALIRRLTREHGVAVMISSHQLSEISGLCNRVAILRQGVLLVEDATDRLLKTDRRLYRLSVATEASAAQAFLTTLNLSPQAETRGAHEGASTFLVDLNPMTPRDLTRHLLDRHMDLLSLAPCEPSLEEVYLQMEAQGDRRVIPSSPHPTAFRAAPGRPDIERAPKWPLLRGLRYEWTRLMSGLRIGLFLLLPALFAGVSIAQMHQLATANAKKVGDEVFSTTQMTAFDGVGKGLTVGLPILMVLIAGLASQSVSGEQTKGTLRYLLLRPISRVQLACSKLTGLVVLCLAGYALLAAASLSVSAYYFDFKDLAEILPNGNLFPLIKKEEMLRVLWPVLYTPILPLIAYTALGFALGAWIRNNVAALVATLGAILLLDVGRAFVPMDSLIGWLPSAHLPSPFGGHSFVAFYCNVVQGVSNATNPYASLSIAAPLAWLAIMMVLAAIALKRKAG